MDVQDGKTLIISNYVLIGYEMGSDNTYPTWADCGVRRWLNNTFMNSFSSTESNYIVETTVKNDKGGDTQDKAFILSVDELEKYYSNKSSRIVDATSWAKANGGGLLNACYSKGDPRHSEWWLRSRCEYDGDEFTGVDYAGELDYYGHSSDLDLGVRPVMWLKYN